MTTIADDYGAGDTSETIVEAPSVTKAAEPGTVCCKGGGQNRPVSSCRQMKQSTGITALMTAFNLHWKPGRK